MKRKRVLWVHTPSIGEYNTVEPLLKKLREEEQKKMDRLIKTNDKENEDGTKRVDRKTEIWKKNESK